MDRSENRSLNFVRIYVPSLLKVPTEYIWWVKIHEVKSKLEQRRCWCYDLNNSRDYVHTSSTSKIVIVWVSVRYKLHVGINVKEKVLAKIFSFEWFDERIEF